MTNNIFEAKTDVIVNPTNLMGPMGAGLAKKFKEKFPGLEGIYRVSCAKRAKEETYDGFRSAEKPSGFIRTHSSETMFEGDLFLFENPVGNPDGPRVLCFPTKRHWKDPSDLDLIRKGLQTFVSEYRQYNIKSITFPKLGCGLGGLDWEKEVKPLMHKYLDDLPIQIEVCGEDFQKDIIRASDFTNITCTSHEYSQWSRTHTYTFDCEIKGEKNQLTYELYYHDDGESFWIQSEHDDIWEKMSSRELEKLEHILSGEGQFYNLEERIKELNSLNDVEIFGYELMETDKSKLSEKRKDDLYTLISKAEKKFSEQEKRNNDAPSIER